MSTLNGYTTLAAVKAVLDITTTNSADDAVIADLITQVSRRADTITGRTFYPRIETRYFDTIGGGELYFDDDLLELTTLTNGDGTVITSAYYHLKPKNFYPKYAVSLIPSSTYYWSTDANGDSESVITVLGVWGYHKQYSQRAWALGSTLNEGGVLNATDLTFTVTSGALFSAGQVIKIESEYMNVSAVATHDITVTKRGDNGTTATTHADTTAVYIWQPEPDIELATRMTVKNLYHNRFGQNTTATATITAAGVVLAPEDIPASATAIFKSYARLC